VLRLQQGHCFEYSTVLASLLTGVGYDAYVVSGYATKEICLMDETRETCPMMKPVPEVQHDCLSSCLPDLFSVADQGTAFTSPLPAYSIHSYLLAFLLPTYVLFSTCLLVNKDDYYPKKQ